MGVNGPRREIEGRAYCVASAPHKAEPSQGTRGLGIEERAISHLTPRQSSGGDSEPGFCALPFPAKTISCVGELWLLCHRAACAWSWIARGPFEGLICFPLWQQKSVVA